jgi:hypothetical protein
MLGWDPAAGTATGRLGAVSAAALLVVTLAGCGSSDDEGADGPAETAVGETAADGGDPGASPADEPTPDPACEDAAALLAAIDAGVEHERLLPDLPTIERAYRTLADPLEDPTLFERADHAAEVTARIERYVDVPPWGEVDGIDALRVDETGDDGGSVQGFASFEQQLAAWAHVTPAHHRPVLDDADALFDLDCPEEVVAALGAPTDARPHRGSTRPTARSSPPSAGGSRTSSRATSRDDDEVTARCGAILPDWDGRYGYSIGNVWSTTCFGGDWPEGVRRAPIAIELTTSPYTDLSWLEPTDDAGSVTLLSGRGGYDPGTGDLGPDEDGEVALAAAIDRDQGASVVVTVSADEPVDPVALLERSLTVLRDVPVSEHTPAWPGADTATGPDEPLDGT